MTRSRLALLFAVWTVFGVLQALMDTALMAKAGVLWLFVYYLPLAWFWAGLTPVVGAVNRRLRARFDDVLPRVAAHIGLLIVAALFLSELRRILERASGYPNRFPFWVPLLYFADLTIVSYLGALWLSRAFDAGAVAVERDRRTQVLSAQLVDARTEFLELQLRPHFLFNALSAISELAHEAPQTAARMLRNVIALFQSAVDGRRRGLVTLDEELTALEPYLAIQRLRFPDWLSIEEDISPEARAALVPRFILQPLVENAVHHGLIGRSEAGRIAIRGIVAAERLEISVSDNGVGLLQSSYRSKRGIGLENVRARLDAVYGSDARAELVEEAEGGTTARVHVPLRAADAQRGAVPENADTGEHEAAVELAPGPTANWTYRHWIGAWVLVWTAVGALRFQHSVTYLILRGRYSPTSLDKAIRFDVAAGVLWMLMGPICYLLARRFALSRDRVLSRVVLHAASACVIAFAHMALTRWITADTRYALWSEAWSGVYAWNVGVYALILLFAHQQTVQAWIRERDVAAYRLRTELREARLQKVMLDLRPRVLTDALEKLAEVVLEDAAKAEELLEEVGTFLRSTLENARKPDATLRNERDSVGAYARVLMMGSSPQFGLDIVIPSALLDAHVPNGVLRAALDAVVERCTSDIQRVQLIVSGSEGSLVVSSVVLPAQPFLSEASGYAGGQLKEYAREGLVDVEHRAGELRVRLLPRVA